MEISTTSLSEFINVFYTNSTLIDRWHAIFTKGRNQTFWIPDAKLKCSNSPGYGYAFFDMRLKQEWHKLLFLNLINVRFLFRFQGLHNAFTFITTLAPMSGVSRERLQLPRTKRYGSQLQVYKNIVCMCSIYYDKWWNMLMILKIIMEVGNLR